MRQLGKDFVIGCNYFASNAGCNMWHDWDERAVDEDFAALKANGMDAVRIFPIWPDFQPLQAVMRQRQVVKEYYVNGKPLDNSPEGKAGIDPVVGQRYRKVIALAEKHGMSLMVEMITGWMSGRNYVPAAFMNRNVITDALVNRWQVRLIEYLVHTAKDSPAVIAWGLGNETNCMDTVDRDQACTWTALLTRTIRAMDPTRPIVSGMHGLAVSSEQRAWHMEDQGEHNDVTTIHPYPAYTPHCHRDGLLDIRTILHSAAESQLTAHIAGKPCLAQEVGVLGPMFGSDEISAEYMKSVMWSLWAGNDLGCIWWMGFDADCSEAPYDWQASERELGFMTQDRQPKPVLKAMRAFRETLDTLPEPCRFPSESTSDAVCFLTGRQDHWGVAYAAHILAKSVGFDVRFVKPDHDWPDAELYLLPSCEGTASLYRRHWKQLMPRIEAGATLYISMSNAVISGFKDITGLEVQVRRPRAGQVGVNFTDGSKLTIPTAGSNLPLKYQFKVLDAEVLATEDDGNPVFARKRVGKGWVYFLGTAMETALSHTSGVYEDEANDFAAIYREIGRHVIAKRLIRKEPEQTALHLSEHPMPGEDAVMCVAINHASCEVETTLTLDERVKAVEALHGAAEKGDDGLAVRLGANDAVVVRLQI